MAELGMIDSMGYGIYQMNDRQAKRYSLLPDYEMNGEYTELTIYAFNPDLDYTNVVVNSPDLTFDEIVALDKEQKSKLYIAEGGKITVGVWAEAEGSETTDKVQPIKADGENKRQKARAKKQAIKTTDKKQAATDKKQPIKIVCVEN